MSNNFRKNDWSEKNMNCELKLYSQRFYKQILGAATVLKFHQTLALAFPCIFLQFFPGNFSWH